MKFLLLIITITPSAFAIAAQTSSADFVITGAKIHTVDFKNSKAEALAIKDNRIIAVGKTAEIRKLVVVDTIVIDAKGRLVLPGFNDSHVHFTAIGNLFTAIDLRFITGPEKVAEKLREYVRFLPKGRWILGGQWDHNRWSENLPTKELIDAVTPDNPVFLYSKDAKMAWVNSAALKVAGIGRKPINIRDGEIVRDKNGDPTGILKERAILLVKQRAPKLAAKDWYEVTQAATNYAASLGVTSVQDVHSDDQRDILDRLEREGKLKTRVYDCIALIKWKELVGKVRSKKDAMIRTGCLKAMADSDPESEEVMFLDILAADKAGLQVAIHAIGQKQNQSILKIFERVIEANGNKDRRFRVEHAYRFPIDDLSRFANSKIIPSLQPRLFYGNQPYRSFINSGVKIAFGSDASMTDFDPLKGVAAAVNFSDTDEAISVEEAVYLYTMGSAYAEFEENEKGSIEVGKLADLVILSDDIFSMKREDIANAKVLLTIVDGKIVYRDNTF